MDENGIAVDAILWNGVFAPAGTPPDIVEKLENALTHILSEDSVKTRLNASGIDADLVTGGAFAERIRSETARYNEVIRLTGIKIDR